MQIKIVVIIEAIFLVILSLVGIKNGFKAYTNFTAENAVAVAIDELQIGRYTHARDALEATVAARPDYEEGHIALLYAALNVPKPEDATIKALAEELLAMNDGAGKTAEAAHTATAVIRIRQAKKSKTRDEKFKLLIAADQALKKAGAATESRANNYVSRGIVNFMLYKETRRPDYLKSSAAFMAKAQLNKDISINSLYPLAFTEGLLMFEQGRDRSALERMRRSMELDPTGENGITNLALAYARRLRSKTLTKEQKLAILQETQNMVKSDNPAHYALLSAEGTTFFDLEEWENASRRFHDVVYHHKDRSAGIANGAAVDLVRSRRLLNIQPEKPVANAVDALLEALDKDDLTPRHEAKIINMLGLCKEAGYPFSIATPKPLETAEFYYREARRIDPTFWASMRNLGASHQRRNEWKDALRYYKESSKAKKQPDLARAVKLFMTPPQIAAPPSISSALSVVPGEKGATRSKFPALLLGVLPSYPGRIEKESSKISINGIPQPFWKFVSDHNIILVSREELGDGNHKLKAEFSDAGGNKRVFDWDFSVDLIDPSIENMSPETDSFINAGTVFKVTLKADTSGSDFSFLKVSFSRPHLGTRKTKIILSGVFQYDATSIKQYSRQKVSARQFKFMLPPKMPAGKVRISMSFKDRSGRAGKAVYNYDLKD
jgi:hypothetical protein